MVYSTHHPPVLVARLATLGVFSVIFVLLAAADATSKQFEWEPLGLSGGGGMFSPAISPANPDLMMINCDMSAAYLSQDGGHNWRMIHQRQLRSDTRCRPAFHPSDPNIIYASSGGQLRVSRDRGQTFSPIGDLKTALSGEIAIDPTHPDTLLTGTRDGRCHISRNAGETWTPCQGPRGQLIGFHFDRTSDGKTMFAATDQSIWRSDDGGRSWTERTAGLPWKEDSGIRRRIERRLSCCARLYCCVRSKDEQGKFVGGVYVSDDRGDSWQSAMGKGINTDTKQFDQWAYGPIAQYMQLLTTDANPLTVYAMNTSTGFHPPHHETVYRSDDGGKTWRDVYFMDPRFQRYNIAPDYVTASTGQSWKGGNAPFGVAICNSDPDRMILTRSHCHITHNGGASWFHGDTYPAAGQTPKAGSSWVCNGLVVTTTWHYYVDPHEPQRHYIAYTDLGFARSLDAGKTWIWWDQTPGPRGATPAMKLPLIPPCRARCGCAFRTYTTYPTTTSFRNGTATMDPAASVFRAISEPAGSPRRKGSRPDRSRPSCSTRTALRAIAPCTPACLWKVSTNPPTTEERGLCRQTDLVIRRTCASIA